MGANNEAPGKLRSLWVGYTSGQRIGFIGSGIAVVVGLLALGAWFLTADYSVLFGDLAPEDAAEIVETLQAANVPFRLTDGGSVVQVPADRVFEQRIKLAARGIPQSGEVGYEIFNGLAFGENSSSSRRTSHRRSLEGELTRTIREIEEVEGARVHLALPDETLPHQLATASVVLKLRTGSTLTDRQARAIAFLVASSIEGLTPGSVTIADISGNVLHRGGGANIAALALNQFEHKNNFEQQTEKRIRAMLERVFDVAIAVVRVSADFNFDQVEQTAEVYDPANVVVRSEELSIEETAGSRSAKETERISYEVSRTVTRTVKSPGRLERVSVAVVVDGGYREDPQGGEKTFVPRSPEELGRISSLVGKVVGIDSRRGDYVEVLSIPFKPDETAGMVEGGIDKGFYLMLTKYGIGLAAALFFFFAIFRPFISLLGGGRAAGKGSALAGGEITTPVSLEQLEREMGLSVNESAKGQGGPTDGTPPTNPHPNPDALKKQLIEQIEQEPEVAANLIRSWVAD